MRVYTVKNEVCKAHQIVSIHTLLGEKCAYRDILVCMAHFSIYSVDLKYDVLYCEWCVWYTRLSWEM